MARRRFAALASASAAAVLLLAASGARAQVSECPISAADSAKQDYTAVKAACVGEEKKGLPALVVAEGAPTARVQPAAAAAPKKNPKKLKKNKTPPKKLKKTAGPDFCGACSCALIDVFAPALAAAAATPEGAAALKAADPVALASDVLTICVPNVLPSVVAAGVPLSSLEGLTSCDFSGEKAPVPQCLTERVAALTGGSAAEVAAADGADEEQEGQEVMAAQGPGNLRVATVQQLPGGGVSVTLAGQLNDAAGLLAAFARSDDLLDALPEQQAADVKRLSASPEALAAVPDTNAYLSQLKNPVDAVAVINRLAAIDAAAPKAAGGKKAAPATNGGAPAAPAPNGAAAAASSLAGSALMGALMATVVLFA
jgi:hypothetical protein